MNVVKFGIFAVYIAIVLFFIAEQYEAAAFLWVCLRFYEIEDKIDNLKYFIEDLEKKNDSSSN